MIRFLSWKNFVFITLASTFVIFFTLKENSFARPKLIEVQKLSFKSNLLSQFHHREIQFQASLVKDNHIQGKPQAIVLYIPGFGGDLNEETEDLETMVEEGEPSPIIHVVLDAAFNNQGHTLFANSDNNGPWGKALVEEFIPWLQRSLRTENNPLPIHLSGHSSGGWSVVYLYLHYTDSFASTWATAPDPLDFRSYFGVDITPGSKENFYKDSYNNQRPAHRGRNAYSIQSAISENSDYWLSETESDEAAWSHRDNHGKPSQLFNRSNGNLNQETLKEWSRFDLSREIEKPREGKNPSLKGLHIIFGSLDTYFLDVPARLFCEKALNLKLDIDCVEIPRRNHITILNPSKQFPAGLPEQIYTTILSKSD